MQRPHQLTDFNQSDQCWPLWSLDESHSQLSPAQSQDIKYPLSLKLHFLLLLEAVSSENFASDTGF